MTTMTRFRRCENGHDLVSWVGSNVCWYCGQETPLLPEEIAAAKRADGQPVWRSGHSAQGTDAGPWADAALSQPYPPSQTLGRAFQKLYGALRAKFAAKQEPNDADA